VVSVAGCAGLTTEGMACGAISRDVPTIIKP
jgi:hypothetical protein